MKRANNNYVKTTNTNYNTNLNTNINININTNLYPKTITPIKSETDIIRKVLINHIFKL